MGIRSDRPLERAGDAREPGGRGDRVGAVPSLEAGVASMVSIARRLEPDPATRAAYDGAFDVYRALYPALRPLQRNDGAR